MITGIVILFGLLLAGIVFVKGEKTIIKKDKLSLYFHSSSQ